MTACLYMCPKVDLPGATEDDGLPMFLADTMVTWRFTPPGAEPLTPAVASLKKVAAPSTVTLARKLNIFDRFAVALAGEGKPIADTLYELERAELAADERPSEWLRRAASQVNRSYPRPVVSALGAYPVREDDGREKLFLCSPTPLQRDPQLGHFVATGSGGEELAQDMRGISPYVRLDHAIKASVWVEMVNGGCIARERLGLPKKAWGGYVEHVIWDGANWQRGPRVLHLTLAAKAVDGGYATGMLGPAVAYDPMGRILALSSDGAFEFALHRPGDDGEQAKGAAGVQWVGWAPRLVVLTIVGRVSDGRFFCQPSQLSDAERKEIVFDHRGETFAVGVQEALKHRISARVLAAHGLNYVPTELYGEQQL